MSLTAASWIAFVILACTGDEEARVSGDRYSGGGCPSGETCAPPTSTGSSPYFVATRPPGAQTSSGELPPVATGATTSVRLVQEFPPEDTWDDGVRGVSDAVFVAEGLDVTSRSGSATLTGSTAGTYLVRAENADGELYDQVRIRVVDPVSVIARPTVGVFGLADFGVGPESGWRIWPGAQLQYIERATSATGEVLVSLGPGRGSHYDSADAPLEGTLEIEVQAGALTRTTTFEVATEVDSFVAYFTDACGDWEGQMCLFGAQAGAPIVGAPIRVTDDEGEAPYELDAMLPCIQQREDAREITFEMGDRTWTTRVPPFEDCSAP